MIYPRHFGPLPVIAILRLWDFLRPGYTHVRENKNVTEGLELLSTFDVLPHKKKTQKEHLRGRKFDARVRSFAFSNFRQYYEGGFSTLSAHYYIRPQPSQIHLP